MAAVNSAVSFGSTINAAVPATSGSEEARVVIVGVPQASGLEDW